MLLTQTRRLMLHFDNKHLVHTRVGDSTSGLPRDLNSF